MSAIAGVLPAVRGEIRQSATWSIVLSVLMIVAGLFAVSIPFVAGLAVTAMFGWLMIVTGALHLGFAWRAHGALNVMGEILVALLCAGIGAFALVWPVAGLASLTFVVISYLVAKGLIEGMLAFSVRAVPGSGWLLFDAIVTVAIAAMIASAWPASALWTIGVLVGVAMMSSGFTRLMASLTVRRLAA